LVKGFIGGKKVPIRDGGGIRSKWTDWLGGKGVEEGGWGLGRTCRGRARRLAEKGLGGMCGKGTGRRLPFGKILRKVQTRLKKKYPHQKISRQVTGSRIREQGKERKKTGSC